MMNQTFKEDELQKAIDEITKDSMNDGPVAIGSNIPSIPPLQDTTSSPDSLTSPADTTEPAVNPDLEAPALNSPVPPTIPPIPNDFGAPAPTSPAPDPSLPPIPEAPTVPEVSTTPDAAPIAPEAPAPEPSPSATDIPAPLPPTPGPDLASNPPAPEPIPAPETPSLDTGTVPPVDQPSSNPNQSLQPDLQQVKERALRDLSPILRNMNINPEQKFDIYRDIIETVGDNSAFSDAYDAASQITDENKRAESLIEIVQLIDGRSA